LNLPNSVTFLRILSIPLIVYLLLSTGIPNNDLIAVVIFAIVAFSDAVDGYLARRLNQVTVLGKLLDPLADKVLVLSVLLCFVELRVVSSIPVMILIARDLLVSGIRMAAGASGKIIAAEKLGKYKAALLDIACAMIILGIKYGNWVLWLGVILSVVSGVQIFSREWGNNGRVRNKA
jgi:CDP-diacylglycerol--glycerol-3-phosphate 3-phosphatidyltransferase